MGAFIGFIALTVLIFFIGYLIVRVCFSALLVAPSVWIGLGAMWIAVRHGLSWPEGVGLGLAAGVVVFFATVWLLGVVMRAPRAIGAKLGLLAEPDSA